MSPNPRFHRKSAKLASGLFKLSSLFWLLLLVEIWHDQGCYLQHPARWLFTIPHQPRIYLPAAGHSRVHRIWTGLTTQFAAKKKKASSDVDTAKDQRPNLALFIDGDSVWASNFQSLLAEITKHGELKMCRVYGAESRIQKFWGNIDNPTVEIIALDSKGAKMDEYTDIRIASDFVTLCLRPSLDPQISAVALASNDAYFFALFESISNLDISLPKLIWLTGAPSVLQRLSETNSTPTDIQAEVIPFSLASELEQHKIRIIMDHGSSNVTTSQDEIDLPQEELVRAAYNKFVDLQYIDPEEDPFTSGFLPVKAVAKFFYHNSLGPLEIYPPRACLASAVKTINSDLAKEWLPNPGDLIYIWPIKNKRNREKSTVRSATTYDILPFIIKQHPSFLSSVLQKLGYTGPSAKSRFCEMNDSFLTKLGVNIDVTDKASLKVSLSEALLGQKGQQEWLINSK